jgi:hypothetical protein
MAMAGTSAGPAAVAHKGRDVVAEAPRAAVPPPHDPNVVRQYDPFQMAQRGLTELMVDAVAKGECAALQWRRRRRRVEERWKERWKEEEGMESAPFERERERS